jgi:hypothetical protein
LIEEPGKKVATAGAVVLWLITAALSIMCLMAVRAMILRTLARFGLETLLLIGNYAAVFPMIVFCIAVIIGGFEYHFRRAGQAESWRIFAKTLAIELGILLLALFI